VRRIVVLHGAVMAAKKTAARKTAAKKVATKTAKKAPQSMPYELGKWAHVYTRAPGEVRYWLIKSEPDVFSFEDLQKAPKKTTCWDSVRNTGARNFLRDGMKKGDQCFYYHSNAEPSAIVGICEVVQEGYPDHTAFDPTHDYYDADSDPETPTWFMVDVKAVRALPTPVTLPQIKADPKLAEMALIKVGRLSVVPVTAAEWTYISALGGL
jgi:predicted RNA-binding protein with PUA-like domain